MKPCIVCGGKVTPMWFVVKISPAVLNPENTNNVLGLNAILGGNALTLAEVMAPDDNAVIVASDKYPELENIFHVCQTCCFENQVVLMQLIEKSNTQ